MAAPDNKKKKCATIIPATWPQFTGPAFTAGMSVSKANQAWGDHVRLMNALGPTPKVWR
jgi:hypothetical protein